MKGIPKMRQSRLFILRKMNRNNIEAYFETYVVQFLKETRRHRKQLYLFTIDGRFRIPMAERTPALHFHDDEKSPFNRDDIYFSFPVPEVPGKNPATDLIQVAYRNGFAARTNAFEVRHVFDFEKELLQKTNHSLVLSTCRK